MGFWGDCHRDREAREEAPRAHRSLWHWKREAPYGCARDCTYRQVQLWGGKPRRFHSYPQASGGREVWLFRRPSPCFQHGSLCCHVEDLQDNVPGVSFKCLEGGAWSLEGHAHVRQGSLAFRIAWFCLPGRRGSVCSFAPACIPQAEVKGWSP